MADGHLAERVARIRALEQQLHRAAAAERDRQQLHARTAGDLLPVDQLSAVVGQDVLGLLDRHRRRHRDDRVVLGRIEIARQRDLERQLVADLGVRAARPHLGPRLVVLPAVPAHALLLVDPRDRARRELQRAAALDPISERDRLSAERRALLGLGRAEQQLQLEELDHRHRRRIDATEQRRPLQQPRLLGQDHAARDVSIQLGELLGVALQIERRRNVGHVLQRADALERAQEAERVVRLGERQLAVLGVEVHRRQELVDRPLADRVVGEHAIDDLAVDLDRDHRVTAIRQARLLLEREALLLERRVDARRELLGDRVRLGHPLIAGVRLGERAERRVQVAGRPGAPQRVGRQPRVRPAQPLLLVAELLIERADAAVERRAELLTDAVVREEALLDRREQHRVHRDLRRQRLGVTKPRLARREHVHHDALEQRPGALVDHDLLVAAHGDPLLPAAELEPRVGDLLIVKQIDHQLAAIDRLALAVGDLDDQLARLLGEQADLLLRGTGLDRLAQLVGDARALDDQVHRLLKVVGHVDDQLELGARDEDARQPGIGERAELDVDAALPLGMVKSLDRHEARHDAPGLRRQGHGHARLALRVGLDELAEHDLALALADDLLGYVVLVAVAATTTAAARPHARSHRRWRRHRLCAHPRAHAVPRGIGAAALAHRAEGAEPDRTVRLRLLLHVVLRRRARRLLVGLPLLDETGRVAPARHGARGRPHRVADRRAEPVHVALGRDAIVVDLEDAGRLGAALDLHVDLHRAVRPCRARGIDDDLELRRREHQRPALLELAVDEAADRHQRVRRVHRHAELAAALQVALRVELLGRVGPVRLRAPRHDLRVLDRLLDRDLGLALVCDDRLDLERIARRPLLRLDVELAPRDRLGVLVGREADAVGPADATGDGEHLALDVARALELVAQAAVGGDDLDLERAGVATDAERASDLAVLDLHLERRAGERAVAARQHAAAVDRRLAVVRLVGDAQLVLEREAVAPALPCASGVAEEPGAVARLEVGDRRDALPLVGERHRTERAIDDGEGRRQVGLLVAGLDVDAVLAELDLLLAAVEDLDHRDAVRVDLGLELVGRSVALLPRPFQRLPTALQRHHLDVDLLVRPVLRLIGRQRRQIEAQRRLDVVGRAIDVLLLHIDLEELRVAHRLFDLGRGHRHRRCERSYRCQSSEQCCSHGRHHKRTRRSFVLRSHGAAPPEVTRV